MKRNTYIKMLIVFSLFAIISTTANASVICEEATIQRIAVKGFSPSTQASQYWVMFECPAKYDGARGYWLSADIAKPGLVALLSAVNMQQTVRIVLSSFWYNSLVEEIHIIP